MRPSASPSTRLKSNFPNAEDADMSCAFSSLAPVQMHGKVTAGKFHCSASCHTHSRLPSRNTPHGVCIGQPFFDQCLHRRATRVPLDDEGDLARERGGLLTVIGSAAKKPVIASPAGARQSSPVLCCARRRCCTGPMDCRGPAALAMTGNDQRAHRAAPPNGQSRLNPPCKRHCRNRANCLRRTATRRTTCKRKPEVARTDR